MDHQSRSLLTQSLLRLAAAFVLAACARNVAQAPLVKAGHMPELAWFSAETDRAYAMTRRPDACLVKAGDSETAKQLRLGALIFNSPALLGGQAEKKGLSCGACHQNGRGNPNFQFQAVSGAPGTADVTSGLFSVERADNTFNPLPIPDLAMPDGQDQVDRTDRAALASFVRGQIEEEFSGHRPPAPVIEALLTYLQHIDATASGCNLSASQSQTWQQDWEAARLAADEANKTVHGPLKAFYIRTARQSLRRLHDRFASPRQAALRADLVKLSRLLETGAAWPEEAPLISERLEAGSDLSFYNPEHLAEALEAD